MLRWSIILSSLPDKCNVTIPNNDFDCNFVYNSTPFTSYKEVADVTTTDIVLSKI